MTTYLGVSPQHDSSICFYKNGKIEYFMKEERLSRKKRDKEPLRSLFEFDTEDDIIYCYSSPTANLNEFRSAEAFASKKYKIRGSNDLSHSHHLTHANLAFYNSGFDTSLVFIIDRNGSVANINQVVYDVCRESESVYIAKYPNVFTPIYKNYWSYNYNTYDFIKDISFAYPDCEFVASSMQGIVKIYESATSLIKQGILENGKTMGLSAYGNKDSVYDQMFTEDCIGFDHLFGHELMYDGIYTVNLNFQKFAKDVKQDDYQAYADYAWQVQKQTQEALGRLVSKYVEKTGIKNVCITGGYGLNVVANYYLINQFPDINFFFEPLADDSGNSIGAAMKVYRDQTLDVNKYPISHTFFNGKIHDLSNVNGENVSVEEIAKLISDGKSVAVYQGLAEAGPRALGNRSILFDARDKKAKDKVNKIKNREWYRPFAGMVLEEDAFKYFEMGRIEKSPFMTISFPVKQSSLELIPGVVHVDNTCRIQTVDNSNHYIYDLLKSFKKLTGVSVILNTSFNIAGEPLVETPQDAFKTLENSPLDYIWFPEISKLVSKQDLT